MAIVELEGYVADPVTKLGVGGLRVRAYPRNNDGTLNTGSYQETTTSSGDGHYYLSIDTTSLVSQSGFYTTEIHDPATGNNQYVYGNIRMQVGAFVGANGEAPIADNSVTGNKIADGVVGDAKLGSRTISDANVPGADSGTLSTLLGFLANRIKAITGEASWRANPAVTLQRLVSGTMVPNLNADMLDDKHASSFADVNHTHTAGGSSTVSAHTHVGTDVTSDVSEATNALKLAQVDARNFMQLVSLNVDGSPQAAPAYPWKIQFGTFRGNTDSQGNMQINFPTPFSTIKWGSAVNGDWDDLKGSVVAYTFTNQAVYVKAWDFTTNSLASGRAVRVNYIAIGY
jgi:hypothetical protein